MSLLEEGLKATGPFPYRIRGCSRRDLPAYLAEHGMKRGVEIGVYRAEFTEFFAKAGLEITGIDPWRLDKYEGYQGRKLQERQDAVYALALERLAPYPQARLLRGTSMERVGEFADGSLDFVYIDGNHGLKFVIEDLWEWSKKVRTGGIVAGHDWGHKPNPKIDSWCLHVTPAIAAFTQCFHIARWWVIGGVGPGDRWKSFLWVKP